MTRRVETPRDPVIGPPPYCDLHLREFDYPLVTNIREKSPQASSKVRGKGTIKRHVRPIIEMKWRPRAFSRVSTGDSDILSSCDMNDEHA